MRKLFNSKSLALLLVLLLSTSVFVACGSDSGQTNEGTNEQGDNSEEAQDKLSGSIEIDGSSTVFPITEAVAEEFQMNNPEVKVTVGVSGTGGGFKRFVVGETDISDASRPIKDSEASKAEENGVNYTELTVALDGISVVVNPANDWAKDLSTEDLKKIWEPNSSVKNWSDLNPDWPNEKINLYGPGTDSGTFDYFTEAIVGESGKVRTDFTASEDDNVLVNGVAGDKYALGYFGYAYYEENQDKLKVVAINGVKPSPDTIGEGEYTPLARPIFIYVSHDSYKNKKQVNEFVNYYIDIARDVVPQTGYSPLSEQKYEEELSELEKAVK